MARGELVALVDACDRFDPVSAEAAGLDLSSLLWIRGRERTRDLAQTVKQVLKAMNLVLDAGGFGVVALDLSDAPIRVLRQLPMTTWLRLSRVLEHSRTVGLVLAPEPVARSSEGQTVVLDGNVEAGWAGAHDRGRVFAGLESRAQVIRIRRPVDTFVTLRSTYPTPEEQ